jgi:hypothetical protein
MDWNWFFSSMAQSVAAIVGLMGAFVFTKLISNETDYDRHRDHTRDLLRKSQFLVDRIESRYFRWYNERAANAELNRLRREMKDTDERRTPEEYYNEYHFSPYQKREEVLEAILPIIQPRVKNKPSTRSGHLDAPYLVARPPEMPDLTLFAASHDFDKVIEEREAIDAVRNEVNHHAQMVGDHLRVVRRNPESSPVVHWTLLAMLTLFYVGVIYPLSFLPLQSPLAQPIISFEAMEATILSIRGFLLIVVSAVFSVLVIYFIRRNAHLRHPQEDLDALTKHDAVEKYSTYFANYVENKRLGNSQASGATASGGDVNGR